MGVETDLLICGANWLGDSIMSMPALQAERQRNPRRSITMLVKPALAPLWELHPAVSECLSYAPDTRGTFAAARRLRRRGFAQACVFPNSFRSALVPFLAGARARRGLRGHWRSLLLTDVVRSPSRVPGTHQAVEAFAVLDLPVPDPIPPAVVSIGTELRDSARRRFGLDGRPRWAALIPGAARGGSKRWPEQHFAEVGRGLRAAGFGVCVLGSAGEGSLCQRVADAIGPATVNLAGRTSIPEAAAALALCDVAVANDSGGMHLAAAVGTRVVAVYGLTDPTRTGPLGPGHTVLTPPGVTGARDIPRESAAAADSLMRIPPERVLAAVEAGPGPADIGREDADAS
jgi:heptosyltransferase-2